MTNILQTFFFGVILVMIFHYLIKHYLLYSVNNKSSKLLKQKVRFVKNKPDVLYIPDNNIYENEDMNTYELTNTKYKEPESKQINVKDEILKYINTKDNILKYGNTDKNTSNSYKLDDEKELHKFFQMNNDEKYIFNHKVSSDQITKATKPVHDDIVATIEVANKEMEPYEDLNTNTYHVI